MIDGLTMKNGRLINDRPNSVTGIQKAIDIKRTLKNAEKLEMYSEAVSLGIRRAGNDDNINGMFLK
jgi:hypothetical protein